MKQRFEEVYGHINTTNDQFCADGDTVIRTLDIGTCRICGDPTGYISVSFESYYCSLECLNQEWNNYALALANAPKGEEINERTMERVREERERNHDCNA